MKDFFIKETEKVKKAVSDNKDNADICFALLSDTMLSDTGDDTAENISAVDKTAGFDFVVHLGNFIIGAAPRDISMRLISDEAEKYKNSIQNKKIFMCQGEHDGYRDERFPGQLTLDIMYDSLWYNHTSFIDKYKGVARNEDKPYYFVDIPEKRIRLVFLCSYYSEIDEESGFYNKYRSIDVCQKAWIKNEALDAPEGTTVIIFSHSAPGSVFEDGKGPYIYEGNSTDALLYVLQQAKKRGINIAAWICGAYGYDALADEGGINFVSIGHQRPHNTDTPLIDNADTLNDRTADTVLQDCWDTVILDTKARKIKFFRCGAGKNREIQY